MKVYLLIHTTFYLQCYNINYRGEKVEVLIKLTKQKIIYGYKNTQEQLQNYYHLTLHLRWKYRWILLSVGPDRDTNRNVKSG